MFVWTFARKFVRIWTFACTFASWSTKHELKVATITNFEAVCRREEIFLNKSRTFQMQNFVKASVTFTKLSDKKVTLTSVFRVTLTGAAF